MFSSVQFPLSISKIAERPRVLPFAIAIVFCVIVGVTGGYGAWFLWGDRQPSASLRTDQAIQVSALAESVPTASSPAGSAEPKPVLAPAGELAVGKGIITLSGGDGQPPRKFTVEPYAVAETEVTNDQYLQFVRETSRKPPQNWVGGKYLPGTANEPVVYVTWADAVAYCDWLSSKIGAPVRLPTEAQWELAARGPSGFKYPWGNDWEDSAAVSVEVKGQVRPVKSFPLNRSPFGAFDMAGNVWEWIANPGHDSDGFPSSSDGVEYRLAKGGSANEPAQFITGSSQVRLRADLKDKYLGFRYVVLRGAGSPPVDSQPSEKPSDDAAARPSTEGSSVAPQK